MKHRFRYYGVFIPAVLASALLFLLLYTISRRTVMDEIRAQAMGIAQAISVALAADDLTAIRTPDDASSATYQRIQKLISQVAGENPDVLYAYIMRPSAADGAQPGDMVYVVDQATSDDDLDGSISEEEKNLPVGTPYDARELPALQEGMRHASADPDITSDPPYPDSISGYAPVRNEHQEAVALVGVDIDVGSVSGKLAILRVGHGAAFLLVTVLLVAILHLYLAQRQLAHQREGLVNELREALGSVRTLSGLLPICASCKRIRNDTGEWERIESYVGKRSDAEFSHSICPECTRKIYPELQAR